MVAALLLRGPLSLLRRRLSEPHYTAIAAAAAAITDAELAAVDRLVPRLLSAGHLPLALRLLSAALLAGSPPSALPLPALARHLSSLPGLAPALSPLYSLPPLAAPLLSAFLSCRRPKDASKLLSWLRRPASPCRPDPHLYSAAVEGFCAIGRPLEALKAVAEMADDGLLPGRELRVAVYNSLLMEARIDEARELDAALGRAEECGGGRERVGAVKKLIERMIADWEE